MAGFQAELKNQGAGLDYVGILGAGNGNRTRAFCLGSKCATANTMPALFLYFFEPALACLGSRQFASELGAPAEITVARPLVDLEASLAPDYTDAGAQLSSNPLGSSSEANISRIFDPAPDGV